MDTQVTLRNVSFRYETEYVLQNINFTLKSGEFVVLIGASGSGKSTLLQILSGLRKPTIGEQIWSPHEELPRIGYVFQYPEHQLFAASVKEDVSFGLTQQLMRTRHGKNKRNPNRGTTLQMPAVEERTKRTVEHMGLNYALLKDRNPFELSGGEKRKIAIAGTLILDPTILLLDEPTAGLDAAGRDSLIDLLTDLQATTNLSILLVSHQLEEIATRASRIVVMHQGELVRDGHPLDVVTDTEFLQSVNLNGIDPAILANELRRQGGNVPKDIYDIEAMADCIQQLMQRKGATQF